MIKLPFINYRGVNSPNLLKKIAITSKGLTSSSTFMPYQVKDGERPDILAYRFYDDSYLDWLITIPNNIYDLKNDWVMDRNVFDKYIKEKYGSLNNALSNIKYYTINTSAKQLTLEQYSNISSGIKKYFRYNKVLDSYVAVDNKVLKDPYQYNLLPAVEKIMWKPVSDYDYEYIENEKKRDIFIINKEHAAVLREAYERP